VCELAGRTIGNQWGWGSDADLADEPMPTPMPVPMPMPLADRDHDISGPKVRHRAGKTLDAKVLAVFRTALRDQSRCVRRIAARMVAREESTWAASEFGALAQDADAGIRAIGMPGLGELKDPKTIGDDDRRAQRSGRTRSRHGGVGARSTRGSTGDRAARRLAVPAGGSRCVCSPGRARPTSRRSRARARRSQQRERGECRRAAVRIDWETSRLRSTVARLPHREPPANAPGEAAPERSTPDAREQQSAAPLARDVEPYLPVELSAE
jgi:hypothetical protein